VVCAIETVWWTRSGLAPCTQMEADALCKSGTVLLCNVRCYLQEGFKLPRSDVAVGRRLVRPGSSDRGRPADVNPPEADLVGVEAVEPQVAEDEGLDRTRSHALLTLPWESLPDSPIPRPISYGGYRSKYGSDSMPKGPTPYLLTST